MLFKPIHRRLLRGAVVIACATFLFACQPTVDDRGDSPDPAKLAQIQPGKTDKAAVTRLLGSPSSIAAFDPNVWYYISSTTEDVAFLKTQTLDQHVVAITFNKNGIVESVDKKGLKDAEAITPDPNVTPTRGRQFSWIEEFLGNFGRFNSKK
jgi:outer membrane protein assembly factor BamE (lipoprotein component of BamABCDE complex)